MKMSSTETTESIEQKNEKHCWTRYSESKLIDLEKKILNVLKTAYKGWFVPIGTSITNNDDKIWTISLNKNSSNTPLVMLHGFAAGVCFWCLNLDDISKDRPVYALDLLGFGRSSRPDFNSDAMEAEQQMIESIEAWRKQVNLNNFILLGHSFGGYLATSYAINYPDRVKHLILADPWGFTEKPATFNIPLRYKIIANVLSYFNPLATVRAVGPIGPWLVRKMRSDISAKFSDKIEDKDAILEYIYQCNCQKPSGETAFHNMLQDVVFPKNPMLQRVQNLSKDVPVTVLYGSNSWIDKSSGPKIKELRPDSYVQIEIVPDAGHHINADQPKIFNSFVTNVCNRCDEEQRSIISQPDANENEKIPTSETEDDSDIEHIKNEVIISNKQTVLLS